MSDKLSFELSIEGTQKAKADLAEIKRLQDAITGKGGMAAFLKGLTPQALARQPDLMRELQSVSSANAIKLMPEWFLKQGQLFAQRMGPLSSGAPKINWGQAGLGALVAPFSPWVGARALSGALGGAFGGGSGAGGGIASTIFGAGGMSSFLAFFTAIRVATALIKGMAEQISKAIAAGAKLYQESAKAAVSTAKLAQLKFIGAATGISEEELRQLIVRGEHPLKGGGALIREGDQMFGAGRGTAQIATLQQMKNMSEDIAKAWEATAMAAKEFAATAKPLQAVHAELSYLAAEWKTLWAQVATVLAPIMNTIIFIMESRLRLLNIVLSSMIKDMQRLHLIPKGEPGKNIIPAGSGLQSPKGGWERMGFVIGGLGAQRDDSKKIAENTKKTADKLDQLLTGFKAASFGGLMGGQIGFSHNLP